MPGRPILSCLAVVLIGLGLDPGWGLLNIFGRNLVPLPGSFYERLETTKRSDGASLSCSHVRVILDVARKGREMGSEGVHDLTVDLDKGPICPVTLHLDTKAQLDFDYRELFITGGVLHLPRSHSE